MKKYEFHITCPNEDFCRDIQNQMPDYQNKYARNKNTDYDHTAIKKFESWDSAIAESESILKRHPEIISLKVVSK